MSDIRQHAFVRVDDSVGFHPAFRGILPVIIDLLVFLFIGCHVGLRFSGQVSATDRR
jgi:hypothetical protein